MKGAENKKQKDQEADHLAATDGVYHNPVTARAETKNLSEKELQDKFEVYSRIGNKMERYFKFQKAKQERKKHVQKEQQKHVTQDNNYSHGRRTGLQHPNHQVLKDDREWKAQNERDQIAQEAQKEYRKEAMNKDFAEQHQKPGKKHHFNHAHNQYRNKGMDRDK